MDIAIITYEGLPELAPDDRLLLEPLRERGLTPHAMAWDDPRADWRRFRLAVVRSTWDYFLKPRAFLKWLEGVEPQVELYNSPRVLRWNSHKAYLLELAARGIPVAPTVLCPQGKPASLSVVAQEQGWQSVVIKPAISGGGRLTRRFERVRMGEEGQSHLEAVLAEGDALVQPFLPALHEEGERSYIFFEGMLSHAVERPPTMEAPGEGPPDGSILRPREEEVALAERVLAAVPGPTVYARVDLVTGLEGRPVLLEIEVIEPRLFLGTSAGAAERLAQAIALRARAPGTRR